MFKFAVKKPNKWQKLILECGGRTATITVDSTSPSALWFRIDGDKAFRLLVINDTEGQDVGSPTVETLEDDDNIGNRYPFRQRR